MAWPILAASLAALLLLGGTAWWLRRRGGAAGLASPDAALLAVAGALPGFPAETALVGLDRRAALILGHDARVAVLRTRGARVMAREVRWTDVRAVHGGIRVDIGERRFGAVTIEGVDALDIRRAGGAAMAVSR